MEHIDFRREAAEWISGAFSKKETLQKLVDEGCSEQEANRHVGELIRKAQLTGWKEVFIGLMTGLIGYVAGVAFGELGVFIFDTLTTIAKIGGLVIFLDGIRRLGSLVLVTKTGIIPSFGKKE